MKYTLTGVDNVKSVKRVYNTYNEISYIEVVSSPYHDMCMSYLDVTTLLYPTKEENTFASANNMVILTLREE